MGERVHPALDVSNIRNLVPLVLGSEGVQYSSWSMLFRVTARAYNVLHHIDPTIAIDNDTDDVTTLNWPQLDALVLSWICATISNDLLVTVLDDQNHIFTAMDAWAHLQHIFQPHYPNTILCSTREVRHKKNSNNNNNTDLISSLPDDILIYVLSFLDMKEAGRTSLVSKRWRHIWAYLMDLDFITKETVNVVPTYRNWVNGVIAASRAPYLNTFRIHNDDGFIFHHADIDKWFKFAIAKQVRNLEINLFPCYMGNPIPTIHFTIPTALATLECLRLEAVCIKGPLLEWVLSNCFNLQRLLIIRCYAAITYPKPPRKKLVVTSPKLKHLEFRSCLNNLGFNALHISTPNLTSMVLFETHKNRGPSMEFDVYFNYIPTFNNVSGKMINVEYCHVPSLVDATFGWLHCHHLFNNLDMLDGFSSQLQKLTIKWDEALLRLHGFPTFANLKHLEIFFTTFNRYRYGHDLLKLSSFIEACPSLRTFKLKVIGLGLHDLRTLVQSPNVRGNQFNVMPHKKLEEVEFLGFDGSRYDIELAHRLIQQAPMLKNFAFDTTSCHVSAFARQTAECIAKSIEGRVNVVIV